MSLIFIMLHSISHKVTSVDLNSSLIFILFNSIELLILFVFLIVKKLLKMYFQIKKFRNKIEFLRLNNKHILNDRRLRAKIKTQYYIIKALYVNNFRDLTTNMMKSDVSAQFESLSAMSKQH